MERSNFDHRYYPSKRLTYRLSGQVSSIIIQPNTVLHYQYKTLQGNWNCFNTVQSFRCQIQRDLGCTAPKDRHRNKMKAGKLYVFAVVSLSCARVKSDYPPPSEDGHSYYSQSRGSSGGGLAGTGRVTASFGGGYVGGPSSDYYSSSDWLDGSHGLLGLSHARCVDIPDNLTLCRDIGYQQMRLPNLLEHESLREVGQQASSWVRLVAVRCHPDTQVRIIVVGVFCPKAGSFSLTPSFSVMCLFFQLCVINHTLFIFLHQSSMHPITLFLVFQFSFLETFLR